MGDLKAGEGFIDAVYITNYDHVAVTGLSPTSFVLKLSDGTKTVLTVAESGYGVYKVTDFAPLADTEYFTIWAVDGPYTIYARAKLFKVGGGRTEDIHDIVKASGTGDLAAVLADTNELQTDWVDGGRLDLLLDAVALEATLAVVDGLIDGIVADIGVFPTANYATLAAYVEGVRTRLIAIVADTGELQTDWVNGGRLDLLLDAIKVVTDDTVRLSSSDGQLTADGTEQLVYENAAPTDEWEPRTVIIDTTNMQAADSITIKEYVKIRSAGSYVLLDSSSLSGVQVKKATPIGPPPFALRYAYKVTLQQTAGTNKNYDWCSVIKS